MARFHCTRVPDGPVRTVAGVVEFTYGTAEVDDAALAAGLRELPDVFGVSEDAPAKRAPAKRRKRPDSGE